METNILAQISTYYNSKKEKKNEVLKECASLSPEIFKVLRHKYPYLGDIKITQFGWIFRVVVKYKDGSDWNTYVFPSEEINEEFEDNSEIIAFNNKVKAYADWDKEMDNRLYHKIKDSYLYLDRFLYAHGYKYNVCSHVYAGDKYLVLCTNGNDYVTVDCENKKIEIQSFEDLQAEMFEEKLESFKRVEAILNK